MARIALILLALSLPGRLPADGGVLTVDFLDVGQGDAALLVSPTGKTVLVDAGPPGSAKAIRRAMRRRGVTRLDLVLVSHAHADHVGGLMDLIGRVPIGRYLDPGVPHTSATYRRVLLALKRAGIRADTARAGQRIDLGGGATLQILWPEKQLLRGTRSDLNSNSVVARLDYRDVSILLTGDAEQPTEAALRRRTGLRSDVLKVPHHGSAYSSTPAFLARVRPRYAIVSVGRNDYGHPTPQTLRRLSVVGARVYRTDLDGTVHLWTDGRRLRLEAEHARTGGRTPSDGPVSPVPLLEEGLGLSRRESRAVR